MLCSISTGTPSLVVYPAPFFSSMNTASAPDDEPREMSVGSRREALQICNELCFCFMPFHSVYCLLTVYAYLT